VIQPAFHRATIEGLNKIITDANVALLGKWKDASRHGSSVNVTRDISGMVLEVVLRSIFGDNYEQVALHFNVLSEERARDFSFAKTFRSLERVISEVAARRNEEDTGDRHSWSACGGARPEEGPTDAGSTAGK
jgi:cytochrome P450